MQKYIDTELDVCCQLDGLTTEPAGELADVSDASPGILVGPDSIGTLSFTSGSTGLPKAVRGRHVSLTHFYPWMMQEFSMSNADRSDTLSHRLLVNSTTLMGCHPIPLRNEGSAVPPPVPSRASCMLYVDDCAYIRHDADICKYIYLFIYICMYLYMCVCVCVCVCV